MEIINWFDENDIVVTEEQFKTLPSGREYGLLFKDEVDFMAFKLRWV